MNVFLIDDVHSGSVRSEASAYCFLRRACNMHNFCTLRCSAAFMMSAAYCCLHAGHSMSDADDIR